MTVIAVDAPAGEVVWRPGTELLEGSQLARYVRTLEDEGRDFPDYATLHRWSVEHLEDFWRSVVELSDVQYDGELEPVLPDGAMPGAKWFPAMRLNYAEHLLRHEDTERPALLCVREDGTTEEVGWAELRRSAGALAQTLRAAGVVAGDRVVAYLHNGPEAVIGLIACASIGAVWSVCSPDFGVAGVLARFAQLDPKVLIATDGYVWNGKVRTRHAEGAELIAGLPTVELFVSVETLGGQDPMSGTGVTTWAQATEGEAPLRFARLPFDHPLWVLFSSGTTGAPKGIVHGHGGILLEHAKTLRLHMNLAPGDNFLFVGSTSWMVWNLLVSGLLCGATVVLLDGSPTAPLDRVWRVAAEQHVDVLGVGAGYIQASQKAGLRPAADHDLRGLAQVCSSGSPLPAASFSWVREHVGEHVWLSSSSGGTDVCSAFVGGCPVLPVRAGRLQARSLGVAVEAWDDDGHPVVGRAGELVVTRPMPSMPLGFWGDTGGERLRAAYFDVFEGVWRHGDFIEFAADGSSMIFGRSDSTLNRRGIRMGSADIYAAIEGLPEVLDALVIGAELDGDYYMPLFVVLAAEAQLDTARARIEAAILGALSTRHLPDEIVAAPGIPRTRTGKKLEVPIKRLLQGAALEDAVDPGAVDNPDVLAFYADFARSRLTT